MTIKLLTAEPRHYLDKCDTLAQAEIYRDLWEGHHESACAIVEFSGKFYVVWAD